MLANGIFEREKPGLRPFCTEQARPETKSELLLRLPPLERPDAARKMPRENGKQMETDMDEHGDMKNDAIAQAGVALEQFTQEKEIAKHIKTWMEEKYGPTWHCIVGSEYKTAFTYESKNFVRFNVGKKCIILFRHP